MELLEHKTNIGLIRNKNEDCVLSLSHIKNKTIKLLLVADGMGGKDDGDIASNYVVSSIAKWFQNKDIKTLNDTQKTISLLNRYIKLLNTKLINTYGINHLGTTLSLALINKHETIILNIGDSRVYKYQEKCLYQITEDDSEVWDYYKTGAVEKDNLRYFSNSNLITSCLGLHPNLCKITTQIISNNYEILLLLTDGVTDILKDKKIAQIIKKSSHQLILENLIKEAVYIDQKLTVPQKLKHKFLANFIIPMHGKDNASGVIYIKNV